MANDDWRITVEVEGAGDVAQGLRDLSDEAQELANDLKGRRLSVSVDDETLFIYCNSQGDAEKARAVVESELRANGVEARTSKVEHWLDAEERWDDEPPTETWEQEELDEGYAPWEVRVECKTLDEAHDLAEQLRSEGYGVSRTFTYVVAGTENKEQAVELAQRIHGEVEPGGELVYEVQPSNPFAVFGGLGG